MKKTGGYLSSETPKFLKKLKISGSIASDFEKLSAKFARQVFLVTIMVFGLGAVSNAQDERHRNSKSMEATYLIRELQVMLTLSDIQKDSLYSIFTLRSKLTDSIRNQGDRNPSNRQLIIAQLRLLNSKVDSLLSPGQKSLYDRWKLDRQSKKSAAGSQNKTNK